MTKLFTLKHWQIFIVLVIIPLVYTLTVPLIISFKNLEYYKIFILYGVPVFFKMFFFLFLYLLGKNLLEFLPENHINSTLFSICCIYILVFKLIQITLPYLSNFLPQEITTNINEDSFNMILKSFSYLHYPALLYCAFFIAKVLKTVEHPNENFEILDVLTEFILLLLFPIGIWTLQPRINDIFEKKFN